MRFDVGVDEVGRGCLIGDVVAAAVVLPRPPLVSALSALQDSKKLTAKKRQKLHQAIKQHSLEHAFGRCCAREIDKLNIHHASLLAMQRAIEPVLRSLRQQYPKIPIHVLIDGLYVPVLEYSNAYRHITTNAVVKGDQKYACISAASILAKVYRDAQMQHLHKCYPQYGFDKHKGYATKAHLLALQRYGVLEQHRRSYARVKEALLQSTNTEHPACFATTPPIEGN